MSQSNLQCPVCAQVISEVLAGPAARVNCPNCGEVFTPSVPQIPFAEGIDDCEYLPAVRARLKDRQRAEPGSEEQPRPTSMLYLLVIVGVAVIVTIGAGLGAYFALQKDDSNPGAHPVLQRGGQPAVDATASAQPALEVVISQVKASTVYVRANQEELGLGMGSGFFAGQPGYVVTNAHVVGYGPLVARPATRVEVTIASGAKGERTLPARIFAVDADADLALLRVQGGDLPEPLAFGKAAGLVETQEVLIFGYPYGEILGKSISVNRSTVSSLRLQGGTISLVQVTGGMNPGNSGGPVTNTRGEVIGVSVARLRETESIAFAIPAETTDAFVREQIRSGGRIDTGHLATVTPDADPIPAPTGDATPLQGIPDSVWKPLRLPPVKPAEIDSARFTADRTEMKLPSPAGAVRAGRSGRFLVIHLPADNRLALFDTSLARIVKSIPVASDEVLFAAGAESLAIVTPETRAIERWSLTTFEREATGVLPTTTGLVPIAVAMGSSSNGPLLVQALDYPRLGERFLFDITTMKEVPGSRTTGGIVGALPGNELHASADGRTFTISAPSQNRASSLVVTDGGVQEHRSRLVVRSQPALPAGDGETILGHGEMTERTGPRIGNPANAKTAVWYLPAAHGPLHLAITEHSGKNAALGVRVSVCAPRTQKPLFSLPELDILNELCDGPPWTWRFEQNVFFVPGADVIAVLPKRRDRIVLQRAYLETGLRQATENYLFVPSVPPPAIPGETFDYPVEVRSSRGGVRFGLRQAPRGVKISSEGKLTWDVPADFDRTLWIVVEVTDSTPRRAEHVIELTPTRR